MARIHAPLEVRVARLVVGMQATAALAWSVSSIAYRGVDFLFAAPITVLLVVGGCGMLGPRTWGRFVVFVAEVFVLSFCVFGGFYDDALGWALIVSALLVLPGILPGLVPRHGR